MSEKQKTYKNTGIIALTSFVNIFFTVIKNKILAIYVGPTGLGNFSLLSTAMNFTTSIAGLGLNNSGVQAIAEANTKSTTEVVRVYNSFSRFFFLLSLGCITIFYFISPYISLYLVEEDYLTWPLRIVSLGILLRLRTQVQNVLIIGLNKIKMLAKANLYNGAMVTALSIPLAVLFGNQSIPYLVIIIPLVSWMISASQVKKLFKELPRSRNRIKSKELRPILFLGVATLYGGLLENIFGLLLKAGILKTFDENYLGYYHIAIGITLMYVGFLTSSIANDYYPRLVSKVSQGHRHVTVFVNQQITISMHLIMPALLLMLTFSKEIIQLLYSSEFLLADMLITFSIAGTLLKVVSWPIAYVFLAHRATKKYMITEMVGNGSHLILVFIAFYLESFTFLGIAYVLHYIIYLITVSTMFGKFYKGYFSRKNIMLFVLNSFFIISIIFSKFFLPNLIGILSSLLIIAIAFYLSRKEYKYMLQSVLNKLNG